MNFTFLGGFAILFYVLKSIFLQLVALYKFFCLRFIETYYILMLQYSKSIFNSNQNKLMSQAEHQPSSHTQTRTQKSPQRQRPGINYLSNHSIHTHNSNPQLEYLKLKQQARREVENYLKQIQLLKDELFRKNDEIQHLKSTVIMNLKKDLNDTQRDNIKNYKENQRQARQIEKLRADNFSMQQQIQKNSKQKRSYFAKLEDLKEIKETTKRQILEKDKIIRTYAEQNKRLQKEVSNSRLQIQDLSEQINEKEKRLFQSESQYKSILQKNFVIQSELKSLQLRQRDHQIMVNSYKQKIGELQKQKEDLLEKIDEEDYSRNISQDRTQSIGQTQMLQVKALMEQIYNLLDEKKQQNKVSQKKFLASISCLERTLSKK